MEKITKEQAVRYLTLRPNDELALEISERFSKIDGSEDFWQGVASGLNYGISVIASGLPDDAKRTAFLQMLIGAADRFLAFDQMDKLN